MAQYSIKLPENLKLTVELSESPIHLRITFPNGGEVIFDHSPDPKGETTGIRRIQVDRTLSKTETKDSTGKVLSYEVKQIPPTASSLTSDPEISFGPPSGSHP